MRNLLSCPLFTASRRTYSRGGCTVSLVRRDGPSCQEGIRDTSREIGHRRRYPRASFRPIPCKAVLSICMSPSGEKRHCRSPKLATPFQFVARSGGQRRSRPKPDAKHDCTRAVRDGHGALPKVQETERFKGLRIRRRLLWCHPGGT